MRKPRYMLRYFHVPTLSWMGGRCYDDLGRAADDYIGLASLHRDTICRVEIYDHATRVPGTSLFAPEHLLFVDEWADDLRQQIANVALHRVERALSAFLSVGGAS